jgi:hypothetical protein
VLGCPAFPCRRVSYRLARLRRPALHFRLQRRRLKAGAGAKKLAEHQAADPVRVSTFVATCRLRFINFEAIALRAGMRRVNSLEIPMPPYRSLMREPDSGGHMPT